ncbi:MAG: prephenate dehydrogenase [Clostridium sp.]
MELRELNITIVGLGLIGGSYAKALRKFIGFKNIWAIDINKESLNAAESLKVIDKGFIINNSDVENFECDNKALKTVVEESDIIIMCLYPEDTIKFLKDNIGNFKNGAIITDVVGVKASVIEEINSFMRKDVDFIGGHPMAGNEFRGFQCSDERLFEESEYILTPTNKNKAENVTILTNIVLNMGFKNVRVMDAQEHDNTIAFTSHLPHVIAISLANSKNLEQELSCIGRSFKGATRVANLNYDLWGQLFIGNSKNLIKQLDMFKDDIEIFQKLLIEKDLEGLKKLIKKANMRREEINK